MTFNFNKRFWFGLFFLHVLLRVSSLWTTFLDVDESQFAGFAHVLLKGGLPYLDSLDTKPLGIYLYYVFCFLLFGKYSMWGVHLISLFWTFLSPVFLYRIFSVLNRKHEGKWAAIFFVIFSTTFIPKYISTFINSVMVPLLVISMYFVVRSLRIYFDKDHLSKTPQWFALKFDFWAGFILGMAFLFKYQAGIQTVHFFFMMLLGFIKGRSFKEFFVKNFVFGLSFLVPFLFHSLVLYQLGVWDDFVLWSFEGSHKYLTAGSQSVSFFTNFLVRFGSYAAATILLWILSAQTLFKSWKKKDWVFWFVFWWFVLSLIPVCLGGRFYAHYFLQLLPPLCSLAVLCFSDLKISLRSWRFVSLVLPAMLFWILRADHKLYLQKFPDDELYEQKVIGEKLKEISKPNDRIFVWGFATAIYFYAERSYSSRFLWSDWLTGRTPSGSKLYGQTGQKQTSYQFDEAWDFFWQDMKRFQPQYFIDTAPANIHGYKKYPIKNYPKLKNYLENYFEPVFVVEGAQIYKRKKVK